MIKVEICGEIQFVSSVLFSGVDYSRESEQQNGHDPSAYAFSEFVGALQVGEGLSNIARCTKEKH